MSTAEPFMPAHWPSDRDRARDDIDIDADTDVIPPDDSVDAAADVELADLPLPENDVFRTPEPGHALSEDELEADLSEDSPHTD